MIFEESPGYGWACGCKGETGCHGWTGGIETDGSDLVVTSDDQVAFGG